MKKSDAIKHFGSVSKLAAALGITKQAIYQWPEQIDALRACQIEVVTKGTLRADGKTAQLEPVTDAA